MKKYGYNFNEHCRAYREHKIEEIRKELRARGIEPGRIFLSDEERRDWLEDHE